VTVVPEVSEVEVVPVLELVLPVVVDVELVGPFSVEDVGVFVVLVGCTELEVVGA
jgi:hypothetical protein